MYRPEGLDVSRKCADCKEDACDDCYDDGFEAGADAMLEALMKWLTGPCNDLTRDKHNIVQRRDCFDCWQKLLQGLT